MYSNEIDDLLHDVLHRFFTDSAVLVTHRIRLPLLIHIYRECQW